MKKFGKVYFSVFGVVVLVFGVLLFLLSVTGRSFPITLLETPGEFLWWRGIILLRLALSFQHKKLFR